MTFHHFPGSSTVTRSALLLVTLLIGGVYEAGCFSFDYSTFDQDNDSSDLSLSNSYILFNAIQVTPDVSNGNLIVNQSGRALYKRPFRLGSNSSFSSSFDLNISNKTNPGGEGLAFILTGDPRLPPNSSGQWLGIVNEATNRSNAAQIVAVEFDTRKSYPQDLDDNHVGLDVNSIYSIAQKSLSVKLSNGTDVKVRVDYGGNVLRVFVGDRTTPVISEPIDLSRYLPKKIYVGFSASTGNQTQLNCVRSWEFSGLDLYKEGKKLLWVWITVPLLVLLSVIILLLYCRYRREDEGRVEDDDDPAVEQQIQGSSMAPRRFSLKELRAATGNFNKNNQLGEGGFGKVYKGVLEKKEVAVKRFTRNSHQGKQDFVAEVTTIGNLNHKNLVKLVGWCYERSELLLVYEFMPNKSLDKLIFTQKHTTDANPIILDWSTRLGIIRGVAQALDYLHNELMERVLHRDIKASNIMLDTEFNARLGDFGLARTIHLNDQTHHSTQVLAGTQGYMAPESFHNSRATVETDVYAFGVLLLEVVCARKPGAQCMENNFNNSIVDWVWEHHKRNRLSEVLDPRLNGDFDREEAKCVLMLAMACCHPNPYQRPSMRTASRVLTGEVIPPIIPLDKPVFMWPATAPPSFNENLDDDYLTGGQMTPLSELSGR